MTFKTAARLLAPSVVAISLISCSVKAPPEAVKPSNDDLVEQNSALAALTNEDLVQILLDEVSRVDRALELATAKIPKSESQDGCLTYSPGSDGSQLFVRIDCTGTEDRRDGEKIGRTMRGREVLRGAIGGVYFGGGVEVRRFRPNAPKKTLRTARLSHSIRILGDLGASASAKAEEATLTAPTKLLEAKSRTEFLGAKAKDVANAETWTALITSQWNRHLGAPVTLAPGAELTLVFKAENGTISNLRLSPVNEVTFARADNNECMRPIGTFSAKLTAKKSSADVEETVADKKITTTTEGFTFSGSTSVVPWPMGCLENVSP